MKTAGYIIASFGGLAFIGALLAGNSVFGPLFWLALGFVLVYFGKKKEEEKQAAPKENSEVKTTLTKENKTARIESSEVAKTYWEKYKRENPLKSSALSTQINMDFTTMSDRDVREVVSSAERMAASFQCDISEIRGHYLNEISKYPSELLPEMIAMTLREADQEGRMFGISPNNTMSSIMGGWLRDRHEELGKPDARVAQAADENELETVKDLCPSITDKIDIQERLKSLREMSVLWKCPLKELKDFYIEDLKKSYDGACDSFHCLIDSYKRFAYQAYEVANKAKVKPSNTTYGILCDWLSDFMKEERKRFLGLCQVRCPRCGSRNVGLSFFGDEFECKSCDTRFGGL